tara:strand:+ start:1728 stop:2747 length:1020 start_codon:yes stop_codon:yes gene_type:complete
MDTAEVIRTDKTYKKSKDKNGNELPLGTIEVRMSTSGGGPRIERFVQPLLSFNQVPLIGEHVLIVKGPSVMTNSGAMADAYYYIAPIPIHGNKHLNPLPDSFKIDRSGASGPAYAASAGPKSPPPGPTYKPGENFKEVSIIKNLQPYEGDILIEGRHGQSMRMSTGVGGSISQYKEAPFWKGDQGTPITILSNGHKPKGGPNDFVIENPDDTNSIIILSSKQKINLTPSQKNLGKSRKVPTSYASPQVIISSDRLHFNAKIDDIILSAKTDVIVATPDWAAEMNEVLTILDEFLKIMQKITSAASPYPTSPGLGNGPTLPNPAAGDVAALVSRMSQLKQ